MVAVVNSWSGSLCSPTGYFNPPPAGVSVDVAVANTGNTGNWLLAICAWQTPTTFGSTVAVGDDAHNRWEPLGAPGGTSSASGITRCSIWAAPAPAAAANVFAAPSGYCQALACLVLEVSGLPPWLDNSGVVTAYANAATALAALTLAAPLSQALVITTAATDLNTATVTLAAGGWTAITPVAGSNGTDHNADITITPAYQVTTGATTATFTSSVAQDMSGVCVAVLVNPPAPMTPSQTWPLVQLQAGFGSGVQTPWDQVTWTDITGRFRGMSTQRGKQYELDTIQAGTVNLTLANNDGALTPGNTASPFYPAVTIYTPVRILATWPPPPAANARTYVVFRGFIERWPVALTSTRYQNSPAVATDVWATLTPLMRTIARAEILLDQPFAYWPLSDVAGSASAANLAGSNTNPLQVVTSKYGPGSATATFGNTPSNLLSGDPSTTVWAQSGLTSGQVNDGYAFLYTDSGLPSIANGVTIEGWFQVTTSPADVNGWTLINVKNTAVAMARVWIRQTDGALMFTAWDKSTRAGTNTVVNSSFNWANNNFLHIGLLLTTGTWQVVFNGGAFAGASGTCNLGATWAWVDFAGEADRLFSGGMFNGQVYGLAIFPRLLPNSRVLSHFYSGTFGLGSADQAGGRIERILADSGCLQPRTIGATVNSVQAALDIQGQAAGQSVVNIAESEGGLLFVDGPGYLRYMSRRTGYNLPSSWTAGERAGFPLNTDPSFAGTLGPWTAAGGTVTLTQAQVYGGPYSALLTPTGLAANSYLEDAPAAVTVGGSYIASAYVWSPTGYASVTIGFDWFQAGGSFLSTSTVTVAVAAGTWTPVTTTQTAPANAVTGAIRVGEASTPAAGNLLYVAGYGATMIDAFQTEAPYQGDITFDFDPAQVFDDITITQYAAPQAIGGPNISTVAAVTDQQSIAAYGDLTLQQTIYLSDGNAVTDQANWILNTSDEPLIRVSQMVFDPSANPALWPIVLGAEVGQVITVNRRLGGTLTEISGTFQVLNVAHQTGPRQWTTRLSAVTYPGSVLTSDDPVRGQLSGQNALGWLGGTVPLPPYPILPAPRTWGSAGPEPILVPELRNDVTNAATLFLNPPMIILQQNGAQSIPNTAEQVVFFGNEVADPWNMHTSNSNQCFPPLFGWYLVESAIPTSYTTNATGIQLAGIAGVQSGGALTYFDGGKVSMMTGFDAFPTAAKLMHITQALDYFSASTYQSTGAAASLAVTSSKFPQLHAQWVCATSGTAGLPVPSNPAWPVPPAYITSTFLNANIRDTIRFLAYPPICEVASGSNQGIASAGGFPTVGIQLTNLTSVNVDTYSGWASNQYTAPRAGLYYLYAQVNWPEGSVTTGIVRAAGLTVTSANYNGGTQITIWGNSEIPNTGATGANLGHCSVVKRHLRLNQGDTVQVAAFSNDSGGTRQAGNAGNGACRFISVWKAS